MHLVEGSNYDFYYTEGNDPRGSYASTDGHGSGYIFLDYAQAQQYDPTRITAHETGHVLGLPDHYSGPCSELMSGGGPGPSCTNPNPDANERARVNQLWANGLTSLGPRRLPHLQVAPDLRLGTAWQGTVPSRSTVCTTPAPPRPASAPARRHLLPPSTFARRCTE